MSEYIESVRQEAAELGIVIPDADKNWGLEDTTKLSTEL
jgi:hypothetical protein